MHIAINLKWERMYYKYHPGGNVIMQNSLMNSKKTLGPHKNTVVTYLHHSLFSFSLSFSSLTSLSSCLFISAFYLHVSSSLPLFISFSTHFYLFLYSFLPLSLLLQFLFLLSSLFSPSLPSVALLMPLLSCLSNCSHVSPSLLACLCFFCVSLSLSCQLLSDGGNEHSSALLLCTHGSDLL